MSIERIDPYSFLNISPNNSHFECKKAYKNLITNPDRIKRIKANLSYDIICNKNKYTKEGNY